MSNDKSICIIGAGASGLMTALRLVDDNRCNPKDIRLVDATRQPGRVCTHLASNGSAVELGAGRISRDLHPKAWSLFDRFDVSVEPFRYELKYPDSSDAELAALRSVDLESLPARPSFYESLAAGTDATSADRFCTLTGYEALRDLRLPRRAGIEIATTHPESFLCNKYRDSWYAPVPGFEHLLGKVLEHLLEMGVQFLRPWTAVGLRGSKGAFQVDLMDEQSQRISVAAGRIIFAMAPWELDALHLPPPVQRPSWLSDVVSVPLFKGFLIYSSAWWDEHGFKNVCLITSNALQKIYFSSTRRVIFFYADSRNSRFWGRLRSGGHIRLEAEIVRLIAEASNLEVAALASYEDSIATAWARGISYLRGTDNCAALGRIAPGIGLVSDTLTTSPGWLEGSLTAAATAWEDIS